MASLADLTLHAALDLLDKREVSSVELTQAVLDRIAAVDGQVRAYLAVTADLALEQARAADARRARGETAPLLGLPLAIKDNISIAGLQLTAGSRILEGYIAPFHATVMERLLAAGAVIVGKTNLDEFAMGSSTENSAFFTTHNPWDLERVPGGSSGGTAAAVAAGMALAGLGTDTGGSVRQPASLCNLVGLRPTYGRCSRYGLVAFASSLDQPGPMTHDVTDAALLLQVMAGQDPHDATTLPHPVPDYVAGFRTELRGLRVGVPREYFVAGLQPDVEKAVRAALQQLEALGAELVDVTLPHTDDALAVYYLVAPAECSANLARYDGARYGFRAALQAGDTYESAYARTRGQGFGAEVKRRIMLGTYALSAGYYDAYYRKAQQVRTLIKADFDAAFAQVDVLVGPTSPVTAFRIGERAADPLQMYLADIFTLAQALAGIPAVSVPCGFDAQGLPIGLQFAAPALEEARLLGAAYAYEQSTDWRFRRPSLVEAL